MSGAEAAVDSECEEVFVLLQENRLALAVNNASFEVYARELDQYVDARSSVTLWHQELARALFLSFASKTAAATVVMRKTGR